MDVTKSVIGTTANRIKNPIIGSIVVSFILFNWKPIFYLMFEGIPASQRIIEVEKTTSLGNLFWPLLIGLAVALIMPCIMLAYSTFISRIVKANHEKEYLMSKGVVTRQMDSGHNLSILNIRQNKKLKEIDLAIKEYNKRISDLFRQQEARITKADRTSLDRLVEEDVEYLSGLYEDFYKAALTAN